MDDISSQVLSFSLSQAERSERMKGVEVTGSDMCLEDLVALGDGAKLIISENTIKRLRRSRDVIDRILESDQPRYGINTGFGSNSKETIPMNKLLDLQDNLIRSHASGVGEPLNPTQVRRIMALRINTLARGRSGVSLETFNTLVSLFNSGCTPEVPCQGTVGASGDLAPLAHIALGVMGEGLIWDPKQNAYCDAADVFKRYGMTPARLSPKDGLSLVNGTQFITGVGSFALEGSIRLLQIAQPVAAMTLVSMMGHMDAFDHRVAESRPHAGGMVTSRIMRGLVPPGQNDAFKFDVQDPYSIRCIMQIHGPAMEFVSNTRRQLELEMNSSTDNPLVFEDGVCEVTGEDLKSIISAGNFHGEYPAKALDAMALYIGELGRASTARIMLLVDPSRSRGLPPYMAAQESKEDVGLNSGFMCWELTAASLDAENRTLSMPASAETANTGAGKEDHVSMGGFSARKAVQVVENVQKIFAIELLLATHALHTRRKHDPSFKIPNGLQPLYEKCAAVSPIMKADRYLKADYLAIMKILTEDVAHDEKLVKAAPQKKANSN